MSLPQNAIRMYVNLDGSKNRTAEGAIQGFSNGATVYQLLAPIATFPTLAVNVTYELFDGDIIGDTLRLVGEIQVENPVGSGDFETWNLWEKGLTQEVTGNATSQSQDVNIQAFFVDTTEEEVTVDTVPTYTETFSVGRSTTPLVIRFSPGDKADLQAQIDEKQDKNPAAITSKAAPGESDIFHYWGNSEAAERKLTFTDLKNVLVEDVVSRIAYTTGFDSGIDDPVAGFGNFADLVELTSDPRYPSAGAQIDFTTTLADTFEPVTSGLYPIGFFSSPSFTNLQFNNSFTLKTNGTSSALRVDYYKIDNPDDLIGTLLGSITVTFASPTFTLQSKAGVLTGPFSINPDDGETIVGRVFAKSDNIGDIVSAEIGGADPKTFTTWGIPSGDFSGTKMNVLISAVGGKVVESQVDGNVMETDIEITDIARLSQEQTFTAKNTFGDDVDIDLDLLVGGDLTLTGNLIVNGTQTILNVTTVETEDNVLLLAKGQASNLVDIGILGEMGGDGQIFIGYKKAANLFKFGFTDDLRRIASIIDLPNVDEIFTYDSVTGNLITRSATDIKAILDIQISDVDGLEQALLDLEDDKIDGIIVNDIPAITEMEFIGGSTVLNPETGKVTIDIFGDGIGEGIIVLGQADNDIIIGPVPGIPVIETIMSWTTQVDGQSEDTDVFEMFDQNDVTIPNTIQIKKTASEDLGNSLKYRVFLQGVATNPNNNVPAIITITAKKDDAPQWSRTRTIGPGNASADATNNWVIEEFIITNELLITEDVQLFITADIAGVSLDSLEIHFSTNFVSGESLPDVMRTPTYDVNKLGKVDNAQSAESVEEIATTNPSLALLSSLKTGALITDRIYTIEMQGTLTANDMQWSPAGDATIFDIFEADGVTNAQGDEYITFPNISARFDGTKLIIVSLDKIVEDIEARVTVNESDIATKLDKIQRAILGGGTLINSTFPINQREVSGTVVLSAGEYGHDRWRAGSGGCTYTFATSLNVTTITISAGTLEQEIEGVNLQSDDYILHWSGTAQGQIDSGGFAVSPVTETLVGGVNSIVEFNTGTLIIPKLEIGTVATEFIPKTVAEELDECQYYFSKGIDGALGVQKNNTTVTLQMRFVRQMRIPPTVIFKNNFTIFVVGVANALTNGTGTGISVTTNAIFIDAQTHNDIGLNNSVTVTTQVDSTSGNAYWYDSEL